MTLKVLFICVAKNIFLVLGKTVMVKVSDKVVAHHEIVKIYVFFSVQNSSHKTFCRFSFKTAVVILFVSLEFINFIFFHCSINRII